MTNSHSAKANSPAINAIRQCLRAKFGPRLYRIERSGEIHAYGRMPNAQATGWWLYGHINDEYTLAKLGFDQ